eukprot:g4301.t1
MSDLSEYERKRLENIRRNQEILRSLGLDDRVKKHVERAKEIKKEKKRKRRTQGKGKRSKTAPPPRKTRRSKRLQGLEAQKIQEDSKVDEDSEEEEGTGIDYTRMPVEPEYLDDLEFEVYAILRGWRLKKKRELQIEPYKIFQNRTLCEVVRRRRNDAQWATSENREDLVVDLLKVWGIGPSKCYGCANSSEGFAVELQRVMAGDEVIAVKLEESRRVELALGAGGSADAK